MSTQYPILDGRPIDRWRVTELKEELKKRKLITRGLKDDLVKRLDEAIRQDEEAFEEEARKANACDTEPVDKGEDAVAEPQYDKVAEDTVQLDESKTCEVDDTAPISVLGDDGVAKLKCDAVTENALQLDENKSKLDDTVPLGVIDEDGVAKPHYDEITEGTVQLDENKTSKVDDSASIGVIGVDGVAKPMYEQMTEDSMQLDENKTPEVDESAPVIGEDPVETGQVNVEDEESLGCIDTIGVGTEGLVQEVSVETTITVNEVVVTPIALSEKALESNKINMENEDSKPPQIDAALDVSHSNNQVYEVSPDLGSQVKSESFSTDSVSIYEKNELKDNLNAYNVHLELDVVKPELVQSSSSGGPASGGDMPPPDDQKPRDYEGSVDETEDNKFIHVDYSTRDDSADGESLEKLKHYRADDSVEEDLLENKQIDSNHNSNEVDDKCDMNEVPVLKNECPVGAVGSELSHENLETKAEKKNTSAASAEEVTLHDDKEPNDMDSSKRSDNTDGGFMEELNLDHFPDDDFMEEDALETKQVDSNNNPSEAGLEIGLTELPGAKFGFNVDSAEPVYPSVKKESSSEKKDNDAALSEKRKFQDEVIDEPPKRQRRWNSESLKVSEPQISSIKPCTAPKDSFQTTRVEKHFNRSDSTVGDAPKERVVPPSPKPPTNSLRIDRFLRPFTLKAVQELLAKTGNVCSFWMDQIKTHCYVMYSTVEEAVETRNSVYNLQWPPNGGRLLAAEFVDPQEVKMRVEAPPQSPATPVSTTPTVPVAPAPQPSPSARQQGLKQQNPPAFPLQAPPPPLSDPPARRERHTLPPKPQPEKLEPPIVTLDDLFRKTRATPRIYYLPLAEEQVAAKLARGDKTQSRRN